MLYWKSLELMFNIFFACHSFLYLWPSFFLRLFASQHVSLLYWYVENVFVSLHELCVEVLLFCIWDSNFSTTICWKDNTFSIDLPLYCVEKQLAILIWACFWVPYFVPLIGMFVLSSVSHCLNYCSLICCFEAG